ncbi:hypothetical protein AGMMS50239_15730 [Bacteroidia bacterium]|nr:hypothetical protein AGMMS50239_15730 [Bacteroidia bacterium]
MKILKFYLTLLMCFVLANLKMMAQDCISMQVTEGCNSETLKSTIESNVSVLLNAFNQAAKEGKKPKIPGGIATNEARIKIGELWKTSPISCTESQLKKTCQNAPSGDYQVSGIPVSMLSAEKETQSEEIAISFNSNGQISDLNISIKPEIIEIKGELQPGDIVNKNKILDFLEKFRTAYNCKDIGYLETVYSEDALIINAVKRSVQRVPDNISMSIKSNDFGYDYQVKTKQEYITKLRQVFKKNAYVNIVFDAIEVEPHPGKYNIYGVTLKQHWKSSTYSDVGFLYLLIDCSKEHEMQIFVRAWSPEKLFNFTYFDDIRI